MTQQGISDVLGESTKIQDPFAGNLPAPDASYQGFSFSAARFVLHTLVSRAIAVIPSRDFQPVLKNFLVTVSADGITLVATDLELAMVVTSPAVTVPEGQAPATVVLPARRFQAILQAAPDEEVTIVVSGDVATLTAGTATWSLKLSSDGSDFPDVQGTGLELVQLSRKPFLEALTRVRYAVSKAGTKPQFMQVNISAGTQGEMLATTSDDTRFARMRVQDTCPLKLRIPASGSPSAVDELAKLLTASQAETFGAQVDEDERRLVFRVGSTVLIATMITKPFPDVEKLILGPALENDLSLTVDRRELQQAIARSRINADEATSALGLRLESGALTVYSRDKYQNTAEQVITAGWDGAARTLIVNHKFLSEMLAAHPSPSCTFRLGKDKGTRKSKLLLTDSDTGVTGIISQMAAAVLVGYGS